MNIFSLRTIIDDILLIVRNNNISESEDLSRDLIRAWVLAYKAYLTKKKQDDDAKTGDDVNDDDSISTTIGPVALLDIPSSDGDSSCKKRTVEKIPDIMGDSDNDIISISDENGCVYQVMNQPRRHYHYFRRYTYLEPCCYYDNGYIYVDGDGIEDVNNIFITGNFVDGGSDGDITEDDVKIPGWMIPDIKKLIMDNELSFMLKRPSDDSNNSTLSSVKPHGPQDKEK